MRNFHPRRRPLLPKAEGRSALAYPLRIRSEKSASFWETCTFWFAVCGLLDFEDDRDGVFYSDEFAVLRAGSPGWHAFDEQYGFPIEKGVTGRFGYLCTTDAAIGIDDKRTYGSSLDTLFLKSWRVVQILFDVLEERILSAWKLGHLFNHGEDLAVVLIVFAVSGFVNRQAGDLREERCGAENED